MNESDSIYSYLKSSKLFKGLFKFISWYDLSWKGMITVPEEKCSSSHFLNARVNWAYLAKKNSRTGAKFPTIFRLSWKYFNHIIIKTFWKHVFCLDQQNRVI